MRLYHFTSTWHLPKIVKAGYIDTTESNGDLLLAHAAPDVVWLVDVPDLGGLSHGLAGSVVDKTSVRITVDLPDYRVERWDDWATRNGVDDRTKNILVSTAGGWAAADHWYVSERRIDRRFWDSVDVREAAKEADHG
jgi:hypothetical protein